MNIKRKLLSIFSPETHFRPSEFGNDSSDYHLLYNAAKNIKEVEGFTCEIGIREGAGSESILKGLLDNDDKRIHIGIDPYGDLPYRIKDGETGTFDYTNKMKYDFLIKIYAWCIKNKFDFKFFNMEDSEFFKRYNDGIPIYKNGSCQIINKYALVHFDGPHTTDDVSFEYKWFLPRLSINGIFVFDDIGYYDHDSIKKDLLDSGSFDVFQETDKKASYRKIKE
jgi:hypothetical protein